MKFKPKRDNVYVLTIFFISVPLFLSVVLYLIFTDGNWADITILSFIGASIIVWFLWAWFGTYYVITEDTLMMRRGPFSKKIDLHTIRKIEKSYMISAGISLSIERYVLHYDDVNAVMIAAPEDIEQFINQIEKQTNEKIEFHG